MDYKRILKNGRRYQKRSRYQIWSRDVTKKGHVTLPILGTTKDTVTKDTTKDTNTKERAFAQKIQFESFWWAYPKKKSKGQARKTFLKINPDEQLLAIMLATIKQAKKSKDWQKEGGKYIPYPSTWLNAEGWKDEYLINPLDGVLSEHGQATAHMLQTWGKKEEAKERDAKQG